MKTKKYKATMYGTGPVVAPTIGCDTITECRKWAKSFGDTAGACMIQDRKGYVVGSHMRDPSGDGMRWFRAAI